jgi:acyl-CoA thioesterase I
MNRRMMGRHRNIEMMKLRVAVALVLWTLPAAGCGGRAEDREETRTSAPPTRDAAPAPPPASTAPRIVVLGDSLTAGLGVPIADAYPSVLQRRLEAEGLDFEIVNAGVSADTSAGGLERLDWALQGDVRVLIVALGGNDGLRGLPVEQLQHNLAAIIERAQARGIAVILAGMEAPPNYGRDYIVSFHRVYPALAST